MSSLYVHIPFCLSRCSYCSFTSFPGMNSLFERYVQALKKEAIKLSYSKVFPPLTTLFLGGGTPTVLDEDQLGRIIEFCEGAFGFEEGVEISLEANPKTIDFMKLLSLQQIGVNRLSLGIQSFVDDELQQLGRLHTAQDGWDGIKEAKSAGFTNISLDLMSGIPGQSPESWQWSLETAISLEPQHMSLYQLSIEEGTRFHELVGRGSLALPEEEEVLAMDTVTARLCSEAGFKQYEISNYALEGMECKHNINYWENGDYLAIGAGSVAYYKERRRKNVDDPLDYCKRIEEDLSPILEEEHLDQESSFRETVIMGLRMNRGVSLMDLYHRYGIDLQEYYGELLDSLLADGLVELGGMYLSLTRKGMRLANQVMARLV